MFVLFFGLGSVWIQWSYLFHSAWVLCVYVFFFFAPALISCYLNWSETVCTLVSFLVLMLFVHFEDWSVLLRFLSFFFFFWVLFVHFGAWVLFVHLGDWSILLLLVFVGFFFFLFPFYFPSVLCPLRILSAVYPLWRDQFFFFVILFHFRDWSVILLFHCLVPLGRLIRLSTMMTRCGQYMNMTDHQGIRDIALHFLKLTMLMRVSYPYHGILYFILRLLCKILLLFFTCCSIAKN